jgi:pimeloyl-ACP methyl ester carboxylesterase
MVFTKNTFSSSDIELYKEAMRKPGAVSAAVNYYRANVRRIMSNRRQIEHKPDGPVPIPTLFIFGEEDFAIIPETVKGVEKFVHGPYQELRLPHSGHWVQNEAATEVNRALLDFLEA